MAVMNDDSLARENIRNNINENIFVEAGAGSGKTTSLVDRMMAMVRGDEASGQEGRDISRICAITYTKAAANEFYGRFRKRLSEELNKPADKRAPEQVLERYRNALENIDLCFMGTIDSFCQTLLREHPDMAKIPASADMITAEEKTGMYKNIFVDMLNGKYGADAQNKAKRFCEYVPVYKQMSVIKTVTDELDNHRDARFCCKNASADPDNDLADEFKIISTIGSYVNAHPESVLTSNAKNRQFPERAQKCRSLMSGKASDDLLGFCELTKDLKYINIADPLPPQIAAAAGDLFTEELYGRGKVKKKRYIIDTDTYRTVFNEVLEQPFRATMDLCTEVLKEAVRVRRTQGRLTFYDWLYHLRNMLRDDAAKDGRLISYIREKHSYYLVDEFQDTDPIQAEIIFYLTASEETLCSDWRKCVPREGSLFIVGDPKQSIYRFKGADIEQFIRIRKMFENSAVSSVMELTKNFRSNKELCTAFNKKFSDMMPKDTDNNAAYRAIPLDDKPDDAAGTVGGVYYYKSYNDKHDTKRATQCDRMQTAEIIKRLVGDERFKISRYDKNTDTCYADTIKFSDIMVIVFSKNDVGIYMNELTDKNIPVMAEGKIFFSRCEMLKAVKDVAECVADPKNSAALYNVLTGPFGGISENELASLRAEGASLSLFERKNKCLDAHPAVKKTVLSLYGLYQDSLKLSPTAVIELICDKLEPEKYFSSNDLEYYYFALELVRKAESSGEITDLPAAAKMLNDLANDKSSEERCMALQQELDRVRVANLHKVKGLEAPVVILASPKDTGFPPSYYIKRFEAADSQGYNENMYVFELTDKDTNMTAAKSSENRGEARLEQHQSDGEDLRKLYVAATRAEKLLIISQAYVSGDDGEERQDTLYWSELRDMCSGDFFDVFTADPDKAPISGRAEADAEELVADAELTDFGKDAGSRQKTYTVKLPSDIKVSKKGDAEKPADPQENADEPEYEPEDPELSAEETQASEAPEVSPDDEEATVADVPANIMGTMVHRLMEKLVTAKQIYTDESINSVIAEITADHWHEDDTVFAALKKVYTTMTTGGYPQSNKRDSDLLAVLADAECHCELPFCFTDDDNENENGEKVRKVVNGVIDLAYCKDGSWYIVDYKTNKVGTGLDEHYAYQLAAYKKALKMLLGVDAQAYIYHIAVR